jgi:Na+/H+ antiporter NhaD/arsenite permease-like protein
LLVPPTAQAIPPRPATEVVVLATDIGCNLTAPNVNTMNALLSGLITMLNGFIDMCRHLATPVTLGVVVLAAVMYWFVRLELEELSRQGTKPNVGRH